LRCDVVFVVDVVGGGGDGDTFKLKIVFAMKFDAFSQQLGGLGYPLSPITPPKGPNCSLSHLGSPIVCPTTIINTIKTTSSTSIQQIATATIALLLIKAIDFV
jgi:hypothetical protein